MDVIFTVPNEAAKVMFLHLSVCPQGGLPQCILGYHTLPEQAPPPPEQGTSPQEQAPPPTDGYCCRRYASYWNAFLFSIYNYSGKCLDLDDSSGYWNNLTDFNSSTCVNTPRPDQTKPLLELSLNMTCLLVKNINFNMLSPVIDIYIVSNLAKCNQEKFLFKKKLATCDKETIKPCVVKSMNVGLDGGCEFRCECEPVLDTCYMYLAQLFKPPYFSTAINLCDINITRIL